jgi:hypothetical protein
MPSCVRGLSVVAEHATNGADGLAQRAVRDDGVGPDAIEDVPPMDGLMTMFNEKDEEIEVSRNERLRRLTAQQQPPAW